MGWVIPLDSPERKGGMGGEGKQRTETICETLGGRLAVVILGGGLGCVRGRLWRKEMVVGRDGWIGKVSRRVLEWNLYWKGEYPVKSTGRDISVRGGALLGTCQGRGVVSTPSITIGLYGAYKTHSLRTIPRYPAHSHTVTHPITHYSHATSHHTSSARQRTIWCNCISISELSI